MGYNQNVSRRWNSPFLPLHRKHNTTAKMKKIEIDYNDVGTFPKFAKVAIRIMLEMLKCMMKAKEPPVLSLNGRTVFQTEHVMKLFGFSVRKVRQMRADDEIEYMINEDGSSVFHLDTHVQEYIDKTFVSSRTPEGKRRREERKERFNNYGVKKGSKR